MCCLTILGADILNRSSERISVREGCVQASLFSLKIAIFSPQCLSSKHVSMSTCPLFGRIPVMLDLVQFSSVQFISVAQSFLTLCDPMNCSTPGLPVHHQLPEFTQTHIHRVSDAIQPSHPLLSPSSPAPNPSQHQSLFQ